MSAPLFIIDKRPDHVGPPTYHFVAGDTIGFAVTSSPGGTITWDFGDGSDTVEGTDVTHVFALGGQNVDYTITATDSADPTHPSTQIILMGAPPE
jgi:hypothetical protein